MWVKDYMFKKLHVITKERTVAEAVKRMVEEKTNSLIVVDDDNKPVGIVSSYILARESVPAYLKDDPIFANYGAEGTLDKYADRIKNKTIEEIMYTDFHALSEDDAMIEAASYSIEAPRRTLPVVDKNGKLIGAVTRTCIKNAIYNAIYKDEQIDPTDGGMNGNNKT